MCHPANLSGMQTGASVLNRNALVSLHPFFDYEKKVKGALKHYVIQNAFVCIQVYV
jgi:hypothetical protein